MATVIAFTSGKGGVGKTNISTNIGLSLAARDTKVCLFDADTGLSNINILMGIYPQYTIEHVLNGQKSIDEIIIHHKSGVSIVPAASGIKQCTNLDSQQISLLTSSLHQLEKKFDYLLIDTAAGIDSNVLDFVASAQYRVIVITPEPTSLTDSFALLKMLSIRGKKKSIFILVNQVKDYQTSQLIFKRFQKAVKNYLQINVNYLGYLINDPNLNKAISKQEAVVLSYPNSSISCGFSSLADIIKRHFRNDKNLPYFSQYWLLLSQQSKTRTNPASSVGSNTLVSDSETVPSTVTLKKSTLADIYTLIDQQNTSEQQLKELAINLESIYEKKYNKSLKDINNVVALILAGGEAQEIQQLHSAITRSFERQFNRKITDPVVTATDLMNSEQLSKDEFSALMDEFSKTYHRRFNENYFSNGNNLLTQIQQLLSNNEKLN